MARGNDEAFTLYGLLAKRGEPTTSGATSPSISIQGAFSRVATVHAEDVLSRGLCCATKGVPTIANFIPGRKGRSARSAHGAFDFGGADDRELR